MREKAFWDLFMLRCLKDAVIISDAVLYIRLDLTKTRWEVNIWRETHHHKRSQTDKVSLSGVDSHGPFSFGRVFGCRRQLQLPDDHLTVKRTTQFLHLEVHLKHLKQAAVKPGVEAEMSVQYSSWFKTKPSVTTLNRSVRKVNRSVLLQTFAYV